MPSNLATIRLLFWAVALLIGASSNNKVWCADAFGEKNSENPLYITSNTHCDEMVTLHRWDGNCCSLNVTAGNGCILNVMDGWCKVYGSVWTLDYNSTYDQKPCPISEYTPAMLGMKVVDEPSEDSGGMSSFFGATSCTYHQRFVTMMGLFGTAFAWMVLG